MAAERRNVAGAPLAARAPLSATGGPSSAALGLPIVSVDWNSTARRGKGRGDRLRVHSLFGVLAVSCPAVVQQARPTIPEEGIQRRSALSARIRTISSSRAASSPAQWRLGHPARASVIACSTSAALSLLLPVVTSRRRSSSGSSRG